MNIRNKTTIFLMVLLAGQVMMPLCAHAMHTRNVYNRQAAHYGHGGYNQAQFPPYTTSKNVVPNSNNSAVVEPEKTEVTGFIKRAYGKLSFGRYKKMVSRLIGLPALVVFVIKTFIDNDKEAEREARRQAERARQARRQAEWARQEAEEQEMRDERQEAQEKIERERQAELAREARRERDALLRKERARRAEEWRRSEKEWRAREAERKKEDARREIRAIGFPAGMNASYLPPTIIVNEKTLPNKDREKTLLELMIEYSDTLIDLEEQYEQTRIAADKDKANLLLRDHKDKANLLLRDHIKMCQLVWHPDKCPAEHEHDKRPWYVGEAFKRFGPRIKAIQRHLPKVERPAQAEPVQEQQRAQDCGGDRRQVARQEQRSAQQPKTGELLPELSAYKQLLDEKKLDELNQRLYVLLDQGRSTYEWKVEVEAFWQGWQQHIVQDNDAYKAIKKCIDQELEARCAKEKNEVRRVGLQAWWHAQPFYMDVMPAQSDCEEKENRDMMNSQPDVFGQQDDLWGDNRAQEWVAGPPGGPAISGGPDLAGINALD